MSTFTETAAVAVPQARPERAGLRDAVAFAIQHRLVCWGMMTYAGYDDAYVVPGPYAEF